MSQIWFVSLNDLQSCCNFMATDFFLDTIFLFKSWEHESSWIGKIRGYQFWGECMHMFLPCQDIPVHLAVFMLSYKWSTLFIRPSKRPFTNHHVRILKLLLPLSPSQFPHIWESWLSEEKTNLPKMSVYHFSHVPHCVLRDKLPLGRDYWCVKTSLLLRRSLIIFLLACPRLYIRYF